MLRNETVKGNWLYCEAQAWSLSDTMSEIGIDQGAGMIVMLSSLVELIAAAVELVSRTHVESNCGGRGIAHVLQT